MWDLLRYGADIEHQPVVGLGDAADALHGLQDALIRHRHLAQEPDPFFGHAREPGKPGSHRGKGWEEVTEQAIRALAKRDTPLVAILWGRDARNLAPLLGSVPRIESAHPSPMSAHNGFFGTRPFSRANQLLENQGAAPVDWRLP